MHLKILTLMSYCNEIIIFEIVLKNVNSYLKLNLVYQFKNITERISKHINI